MRQITKIFLSASFSVALLVGCGKHNNQYSTTNPPTVAQDPAQNIVKDYKGVWVSDSNSSNTTGCINDVANGISKFRKITIDSQFKTDDITFSELDCQQSDIDTKITKIYNYSLNAKKFATTKDGTKMYAIDLTLQEVNSDNSSKGEKDYLIIGKNGRKLIFIGREYTNTKDDRDNYINNNLKNINSDDNVIKKFINE